MFAGASTFMLEGEIKLEGVVSNTNRKVRRQFSFQPLGPVRTALKNFHLCPIILQVMSTSRLLCRLSCVCWETK